MTWHNKYLSYLNCPYLKQIFMVPKVFEIVKFLLYMWRQTYKITRFRFAGLGNSVGCASDWCSGGRGFDTCRAGNHSFMEIDHEIFSTVILPLPLIQEGQLSVSGERMCTVLVNRLSIHVSLPRKSVDIGKLTSSKMT